MSVTKPASEPQELADLLFNDLLPEALEMATADVKAKPQSAAARVSFVQLLALSGDLARAETHARMAQQLAPDAVMEIASLRQYLRALDARAAWWATGAVPDLPLGPSDTDKATLRLNLARLEDDVEGTSAALSAVEASHAPCPGSCNGKAFADLRDLDDRLPYALEALTPAGRYLWLDFARLREVTLTPISAPFDLLARPARVVLRDGAAADLRLVAVYDTPRTPQEMLGRLTDFSPLPGGLTRAHGQRAFLVGEEVIALHDIDTLIFEGAP